MKRDQLIQEVKREYDAMAAAQAGDHVMQRTDRPSPEALYEQLLSGVIHRIQSGEFDHCRSGAEIVEQVANRR